MLTFNIKGNILNINEILIISFIGGLNYHWINAFLISPTVRAENLLMSQTVTRTNTKILVISFVAWTLTNMDQAFFGYAIPGILEEFNLPLEAAGIVLTISFVIASIYASVHRCCC
jgi:hypothetical protein